ncbi:hypothetical protein KAH55_07530, partial [bacterium]|nr:hypothetical protein [bacterium]
EIICHMGGTADAIAASPDSVGWYFFEWDGQTDNGFGFEGGPTYILPVAEVDARLTRSERTESFTVGDVDNDGYTEIIWPCDGGGTSGDGLFIFSCVDGELTGFPTWNTELALHRASGEMGGSPKYAITADINGNGMKEAIFACWNNGQINIYEATAPDTYEETIVFTDITLTDETIYKGFGAFDVDGNGDDELIFNSYWNATIYMIDSPETIADIDVNNPEHYSWLRADAGGSGLTGALGDQDQDGLPEFYVTLYTRGGIRSLEYTGVGDYMNGDNWTMQEVYVDRDYIYAPDVNPVTAVHGSFAIEAPTEDLDGDGKKEIVVSMIESPISDTWLYVFESKSGSSVNDAWRVINPSDYKL